MTDTTAPTIDTTAPSIVAIRNAWTHRLLLRGDDGPMVAVPGTDLAMARWQLRPLEGTDWFRICDPDSTRSCLNLETGTLALSTQQPRMPSTFWQPEPVPDTDFVRLRSRSNPDRYLNIEHGELVATAVQPGWMSAMWALDDVRVRFPDREPSPFVPDARSARLLYADDGKAAMHVEVTPITSQPGSFFMAAGFHGGYLGLQELTPDRPRPHRIAIFSIWNKEVDGVDHAAFVVSDDDAMQFAPEGGTGLSIRPPLDWAEGDTVAFAVTATACARDQEGHVVEGSPDGDVQGTDFRALMKSGGGDWVDIGTIHRPATGGQLLGGMWSFVEDFRRNGDADAVEADDRSPYQHHVAVFSNPWTQDVDGTWSPVTSGTFAAFEENPLVNIDAVVDPDDFVSDPGDTIAFQLATGGYWVMRPELGDVLTSAGTPSAPPSLPPAVAPVTEPDGAADADVDQDGAGGGQPDGRSTA